MDLLRKKSLFRNQNLHRKVVWYGDSSDMRKRLRESEKLKDLKYLEDLNILRNEKKELEEKLKNAENDEERKRIVDRINEINEKINLLENEIDRIKKWILNGKLS